MTDIREAVKDEVLLFEAVGLQHVPARSRPREPDADLFDGCDVVITGSNESPRLLAPADRAALDRRRVRGRQADHLALDPDAASGQDGLAATLGLEPDQVRVIAPDVGGGFGGKGFDVEDILMGCAGARDRPARCAGPRRASEHMVAMHHGRAQWVDFELGGSRDGKFKALRVKLLQDAGAYPGIGAFLADAHRS